MSDGLMPGAEWRPVRNFSAGSMKKPMMGITVHHSDGSLDAAEARFNDPNSQASAHFGVDYDGSIRQWVAVTDAAFHACAANWTGWVGIEHRTPSDGEGDIWQPLTPEQVAASGRILKWLHDTEGVPIQVTDDPSIGGVAYHSMVPGPCDMSHWGLTGCPGASIILQRRDIVAAAVALTPTPAPTGDDLDMQMVMFDFSGETITLHIDKAGQLRQNTYTFDKGHVLVDSPILGGNDPTIQPAVLIHGNSFSVACVDSQGRGRFFSFISGGGHGDGWVDAAGKPLHS